MKYKDLHYERTDIDKAKSFMNDVIIKFKNARNGKEQIELIREVDNFSRDYITYQAMANLNYSRYIHDVNFKSEKDFYDSICSDLKKALHQAYRDSEAGDTILLAPGCASFDQFKNFEDRGEKFCEIVNNL